VLTVPRPLLRGAVRCNPLANRHNPRRTLLLVHGTAATPEEAWGWGYERQLTADGYGWCDVRLPDRALGDFVTASQYAVFAARKAYRRSGRKVALVGHSQGGAMVLWIAKFWPDVARHASDVIALAGPLHGTTVANALCAAGTCATVAWQLRQGSLTTDALSNAPVPRGLKITSIATSMDELITPQPYAGQGNGVHSVLVQDVCPGHVVEHGLLLGDPVGYALVRDAVDHRGAAQTRRVDRSVCDGQTLPQADLVGAAGFASTVANFLTGLADPLTWVDHEPALPAYAARYAR
jgi:triacylglycerol esterase/lipase EstA (alpha/beta hydrolase family)